MNEHGIGSWFTQAFRCQRRREVSCSVAEVAAIPRAVCTDAETRVFEHYGGRLRNERGLEVGELSPELVPYSGVGLIDDDDRATSVDNDTRSDT